VLQVFLHDCFDMPNIFRQISQVFYSFCLQMKMLCTCLSEATKMRHLKIKILYAEEAWTVHAEGARIVESFHVKCQRQILGIRWQHHVRNVDVANQTGLPIVIDHIVKRRNSILDHIARMPCSCLNPSNSIRSQVDLSWKRRPGRPPKRWLDQIRDDSQRPPADVWSDAVKRGHREATQRSSTSTPLHANDNDERGPSSRLLPLRRAVA